MSKVMCKLSFFVMLTLGDYMILYYQNGTLYVNFLTLTNKSTFEYNKQRIFNIIQEYSIENVVVKLPREYDKNLFRVFRREYYATFNKAVRLKDIY